MLLHMPCKTPANIPSLSYAVSAFLRGTVMHSRTFLLSWSMSDCDAALPLLLLFLAGWHAGPAAEPRGVQLQGGGGGAARHP
jgi:hypothetical protein